MGTRCKGCGMYKISDKQQCACNAKKFDENGDGVCEYCGSGFNIEHDFVDNRVAFAHILAKGDPLFKHLAVFKNNVAIVCSEKCHKGMDAEICRLGIKNTLKGLIEEGKKINVSNLAAYTEF